MSDVHEQHPAGSEGEAAPPAERGGNGDGAGRSVLELLSGKVGTTPRVTLRDEASAGVSAPLIDPRSQEKFAVPQGRGNYQFMGEIARGGMGVILKGHDTDLGRDVAVKVLDKRLCERLDVVQRFVEEAQIGGQLQHPGIVPVYELGLMADERPYFTMKLVKGRTLATLLAEREDASANRSSLLDVFESICQTMAYAHSRGVIHRDLKPANVMVGAFGEVQVVDWGLAKVLARGGTADEKRAREAQQSTLTVLETVRSEGSGSGSESMVGSILGTPAYMPPEQAGGHVDRLDERSDVFALGAILCEILTGLPPYVGDRNEVISAAAQAELDGAHQRLDACRADGALVKLTKQCLLPAPAARPANASVLAERIHQHVVSVEERAHAAEVEAAEQRVRTAEAKKARNLTAALGASVLAIVLVGGGGWVRVQNERAAQERAESERLQAAVLRRSELASEVNEALNESARLAGGGRWDEALAAAVRARALAEGGEAGSELIASVDAKLGEAQRGKEEALRREERARDTARLVAELHEVTEPREGVERGAYTDAAAEQYEELFRAHDLDLDQGALEDAARSLTERGLGSELALVLDAWAEARRRTYDEAGADRLLELAHLVDPDPLRAHLREAVANRELDELLLLADSDLATQPASTIRLLAGSFVQLDQREAALEVFRAGVEIHPDSFALQYWLGRRLTPPELEAGVEEELREAAECYRAALALNPDSTSVRYYLGRVYSKLGEHQRSIDQFAAALELRPGDGGYLFHTASGLYRLGQLDRALALYEETVAMTNPSWVERWSHNGIARILRDRGDVEGALEHARLAFELEPTQSVFRDTFLDVTARTGSGEAIQGARDLLMSRSPDNAMAQNNFAWAVLMVAGGDARLIDMAVELAASSVALDPTNDAGWNTLGVARYRAGDLEGAVRALLESERLIEGGEIVDWLFLAMAYHDLGEDDVAGVWYERAAFWLEAHPPRDPELIGFRAEADALLGGG